MNHHKKARLQTLDSQYPVVIFANGYGDHYLNLPAIRALAKLFYGRLTLVGIEGAIEQIAHNLPLKQLISIPMKHIGSGRAFDATLTAQRIKKCDLLISMNPWESQDLSELIEQLSPQLTVGFFDHYDIQLERNYNIHSVDLAFDFVKLFQPDWQPEKFATSPLYESSALGAAERIYQTLPVAQKMLCIHPDTLPEKMWPEPSWVEFIDQFLEDHIDYYVLVIGLKGIETTQCKHTNSVIPAYRLPIPISAMLLSKADLFVGIDSVFLHIADLFRIPSIALFGPTPCHEWGLRFGPGQNLYADHDISRLPVEQVVSAAAKYTATPSVLTDMALSPT